MDFHRSVLLNEVVLGFSPCRLSTFVDGTVGAGGHAAAILHAHPEIELYLAIDQDPYALELAEKRLLPWKEKVVFKHGNFSSFKDFLKSSIDGILVDLGVSSMQLDQPERGFSFSKNGPLDMRMNPNDPLNAAEIVNEWTEHELGRIFREYGEEKRWRNAARAIVEGRKKQPILTTLDLANLLKPALPWNPKKEINPLTLIFQALRIAVNRELEILESFIPDAIEALNPNGRVAVITFHSLEDRIVKNGFRFAASDKWETTGLGGIFRDKKPTVSLVNKKPICPSEEEVEQNPRSRSAKLRIAERL